MTKTTLFAAVLVCIASIIAGGEANASERIYRNAKALSGLVEGTRRANRAMGLNTRRIPWCGAFAAKVVRRAGLKAPRHYLSAVAWTKWGKRVPKSRARRGNILNIRTRYGWHVSVLSHRKNGRWCAYGGNQSNRSKLSCYRSSSVRGVRK